MKTNREKTITIKEILLDKYDLFKKEMWHRVPKEMREHIDDTVMKSLACGDISKGFREYMCLKCGDSHKIGFMCKGKFCNSCGRLYALKWAEKQYEKMLKVSHRHIVFTIPDELRNYFYSDRDLIKKLKDGVNEVIRYYYSKGKSKYEVGIIAVVHTFGKDIKWNPHVHTLITEGGINKNTNWWTSIKHIPFEYLRRSWQKVVLDIMKNHRQDIEMKRVINKMYKKYPKGFYVNARRSLKDTSQAIKYIGRYLGRAAIAEYRIKSYDGETVVFWYKDEDNKRIDISMPVLEFIGKITQQIHKKGFKTVRRYGLYSRRSSSLSKQIIHLYRFMRQRNIDELLKSKKENTIKKNWKQRMIEFFGENPLSCKRCNSEMELYRVWHERYGLLYHIKEYCSKEVKENDSRRRRVLLPNKWEGTRSNVQLSLFSV
ncbi:MAG: IS91 family transposase [Peptostreptococcaceae bacterium]